MHTNTELNIDEELTRAIVGVMRHREFYGHVIQQFEKIVVGGNHAAKTAAVGRRDGDRFVKLFLNRDFFKSLYDLQYNAIGDEDSGSLKKTEALSRAKSQASGVIEHEVLHVVLHHLSKDFPDKVRGNYAMDLVVNQFIDSNRIPHGFLLPSRYGLEEGKTSDWYYSMLEGNEQYGKDRLGEAMACLEGHSLWRELKDDMVFQEFVRDILRKAKESTSSKGWMGVPSGLRSEIDLHIERKKAQVSWNKVFRNFCGSGYSSLITHTIQRESRRFGCRPGTRKEDCLRLAVIIDTSSSIEESQLVVFLNEVRWIWRGGADVTIIESDCEVRTSYHFNGRFNGKFEGGGGTDLEPALEFVEGKFDAAVYFTDFVAPKISRKYRIPILWILSRDQEKEDWPCDWGRVIKISA